MKILGLRRPTNGEDAMGEVPDSNRRCGAYMLETGGGDVERLRLIDAAYGASTDAWLRAAGLREGIRVVEIGCGSGNITARLAREVGPSGEVVGVDADPSQIEQAERQVRSLGLTNVSFRVADAAHPGLLPGAFDLAYCRLVLMHLADPVAALGAMRDLVRPGGAVACEEMDLSRWACDPPSPAMERCFALKLELGDLRGARFRIGPMLHRLFREAGLNDAEVGSVFATSLRDPIKRIAGLSLHSFRASLLAHGLVGTEDLDALVAELLRLADDPFTLVGAPMMFQCRAIVPR